MSLTPHRRGLLRGLLAALLGGGAARAAAGPAPSAPQRCRHYYDGRLWCRERPGQTGYYARHAGACPFCQAEELARKGGQAAAPGPDVITYSYDAYDARGGVMPITDPPPDVVTTTVYDADGRARLSYTYRAGRRQPPA